MDPSTYCRQMITTLRQKPDGRFADPERHQMVVILSTFGQQELSAEELTRRLQELIQSAEWSQRPKVAAAAQQILADWQSKALAL
jgi:hypothetical protein